VFKSFPEIFITHLKHHFMKKLLIAILLSGSLHSVANACDICGGGTGNYNPFLFPHSSKSYFSLNFLNRSFHTHNDDGSVTRSNYATILLSGQYSISRKLQFLALVPYQYNKLEKTSTTDKRKGMGDMTLLLNYKIEERMSENWDQALTIGGGVKLATGCYAYPKTEDINDRNFQLGTGSTDYILNGAYRIGYRNWIANAIASYKYNTANKEGYRYGDVLTLGSIIAYRKNYNSLSVAPYVQVINESQMKDADKHVLKEHTGSSVLFTGAGLDVSTSAITIGANYQFAAKNISDGEMNANPRFSARISLTL
jgi:hypothetical protein